MNTNEKKDKREKTENKKHIKIQKILEERGLLTDEAIRQNIIDNQIVKQLGKIFLAAAFIAGVLVVSAAAPNILGSLEKIFGNNKRQKISKEQKRKTMQALYNLKHRKLLEYTEQGEKIILKITPRGQKAFLNDYIHRLKIQRQPKWDGLWRIIIFDIPNKLGPKRDIFRQRLKNMGFYQFQKSAFITPFPCRSELETILEYYNLFDYITYLEATSVSGVKKCRKLFNL